MAMQFAVLMLIAVLGGQKIESWLQMDKPLITIFLIILFFVGFMISLYRDLNKPDRK